MNATERFWSKVAKGDGCWEWQASRTSFGYGQFMAAGRGTGIGAHRYSWALANGPIPEGLCVLHRCDNRRCVRPDHLFLGTKADNTADMMAKGRNRYTITRGADAVQHNDPTKVFRGEGHGMAKLTESVVVDIRTRYSAGGVLMRELAAEYGVTTTSIRRVVRGLNWRHVA